MLSDNGHELAIVTCLFEKHKFLKEKRGGEMTVTRITSSTKKKKKNSAELELLRVFLHITS